MSAWHTQVLSKCPLLPQQEALHTDCPSVASLPLVSSRVKSIRYIFKDPRVGWGTGTQLNGLGQ